MVRNKQIVMVLITLSVFTFLLAGCNKGNSENSNVNDNSTTESDESIKILNFRITWKSYSGRGESLKKIVENYNALNQTLFQVNVVDGDEDLTTIETLLNSNINNNDSTNSNPPENIDIYMLPYRYVQYLGHGNKLNILTDDFITEKEYFFENLWKLGVVENKVYGIPWLGHTMGLIYNQNLLEKAGVDPNNINDLDSLVAACKKVEATTDSKGIGLVGAEHNDGSWMVNQFIYGFGGSLVSEDGSHVTINSKESKAALNFYKNVLGEHAQDTWKNDTGLEVMTAFRNQNIAFEIQGLWGITDIWKNGSPFKTGVIPLERIGLYPEVGPMMVALPNNLDIEKRAAAIDFIRYLISTKGQEQIMDGEYSPEHDKYYPFRIPVRTDSAQSAVFDKYPEFSKFIGGFNKPSIDVPVPLWQKIKDEYYSPGLHSVMNDKMSIDYFLSYIEKEGNEILKNE